MRPVFYGPPAGRPGAVFGHKPINSRVQCDLAALSRQEALGGHLTRAINMPSPDSLSLPLAQHPLSRAEQAIRVPASFLPFVFSRVVFRVTRRRIWPGTLTARY